MAKKYVETPAAAEQVAQDTPEVVEQAAEPVAPVAVPIAVIKAKADRSFMDGETRRKALLKVYKNEPKEPIYLSPLYQPYFGKVMRIMINGISVYIRVDGTTQMVPKTFADEATARRLQIDANMARQRRLADIPRNAEGSPGELQLF